jgi:hypothetical protein
MRTLTFTRDNVAHVLCSWCDKHATYNLHTDNDHACFDHFKQWFAPGWEEARILAHAAV